MLVLQKQNLTLANKYGSYKILKCADCGTGYTTPRHIEDESYDELYSTDYYTPHLVENFSMRMKSKFIFNNRINKIQNYIGSGRILNFGCGDGSFAKQFSKDKWQRYGYDISSPAQELAKSKGIKIFDFKEASPLKFDIVTMIHAIEHIENPLDLLDQIKSITINKGYLLIEAPNYVSFWSKLFGIHWPPNNDVPRHLNHFSPDGLIKLMAIAGYHKVQNTHSFIANVLFTSYLFAGLFRSKLKNNLISLIATVLTLPITMTIIIFGNRDSIEILFQRND